MCEANRTPRFFIGETPEIQPLNIRTQFAPEETEENRTQAWVNSNAIDMAKRVGPTADTSCRCAKDILAEVNAFADESGRERQ